MNYQGPERTAADRRRSDMSATKYVPEGTDKSRNTAADFARDLMNTKWISCYFRSCDTFVSFLCWLLPREISAVAVRCKETDVEVVV